MVSAVSLREEASMVYQTHSLPDTQPQFSLASVTVALSFAAAPPLPLTPLLLPPFVPATPDLPPSPPPPSLPPSLPPPPPPPLPPVPTA
eukprot:2386828-Prymnesium_polylepis.1